MIHLPRAPRRLRDASWRLRANARFESRLVWIFGSPRSGSTWLFRMLRSHPAVVPIDEPLIGWYLGPFLCDLPGTSASSLDISNFTWRRRDRSNPHHFFAEAFDDVCVSGLRRLLRQRFYAHVIRRAPEMRPSQAVLV